MKIILPFSLSQVAKREQETPLEIVVREREGGRKNKHKRRREIQKEQGQRERPREGEERGDRLAQREIGVNTGKRVINR